MPCLTFARCWRWRWPSFFHSLTLWRTDMVKPQFARHGMWKRRSPSLKRAGSSNSVRELLTPLSPPTLDARGLCWLLLAICALSLMGCAATSLPSGSMPANPQMPQPQQSQPSQTYSSSALADIQKWRKQLTDTLPTR